MTYTKEELWPKRPSTRIDVAYITFNKNKDRIDFKIESVGYPFFKGLSIVILCIACGFCGCISLHMLNEFIKKLEKTIFVVSPKTLDISLGVTKKGNLKFGAIDVKLLCSGVETGADRGSFSSRDKERLIYAWFKTKGKAKKFAEEEMKKRERKTKKQKKKPVKSKKSE